MVTKVYGSKFDSPAGLESAHWISSINFAPPGHVLRDDVQAGSGGDMGPMHSNNVSEKCYRPPFLQG